MVGHEESSAGSYLADPTSPIPSHCASVVATSTLRVKLVEFLYHVSCLKHLDKHDQETTPFKLRETLFAFFFPLHVIAIRLLHRAHDPHATSKHDAAGCIKTSNHLQNMGFLRHHHHRD